MYSSEVLTLELEQLSGWKRDDPKGFTVGYLLRRLPPAIRVKADWLYLYIMPGHSDGGVWLSGYRRLWPVRLSSLVDHSKSKEYLLNRIEPADTPEDVTATLAIELFKQNILKRGES